MKIGNARFVNGELVHEEGIIVPAGCRIQVTEDISVLILGAQEGEKITNVRIYANPEYDRTEAGDFDFKLEKVAPSEDENDTDEICLLEFENVDALINGISGGPIPFFDPVQTDSYASSGTKAGFFLWHIGDGFIVDYKSSTLSGDLESVDGKIVFEQD